MGSEWKYDYISFRNRWREKYPNSDWTILGLSWWWSGPSDKRFGIHFFGIEVLIWFKR